MLYDRIDHIVLPVRSLEAAAEPFARLGLALYPGVRHEGRGTENRGFFVGGPANEFYVELLGIYDAEAARVAGLSSYVDSAAETHGVSSVVLRVEDMAATMDALARRGVNLEPQEVYATDGRKVCDVASLGDPAQSLIDLRVIQYPDSGPDRSRRHTEAGLLDHTFPLKRLDHLATIAPDLEAATRYWTDVLGIPPTGEVVNPATIIRQFQIGDAIIELLGPATPESPIAQRPPGPASMAAFEVDDLDAAVAAARQAGFSPPDPAPGPLPNTRTATIPATELSGLGLQLLQYNKT
jgi:catechol 2,3-dioxygenase-like lactoylglutathione lyase family enzyme